MHSNEPSVTWAVNPAIRRSRSATAGVTSEAGMNATPSPAFAACNIADEIASASTGVSQEYVRCIVANLYDVRPFTGRDRTNDRHSTVIVPLPRTSAAAGDAAGRSAASPASGTQAEPVTRDVDQRYDHGVAYERHRRQEGRAPLCVLTVSLRSRLRVRQHEHARVLRVLDRAANR
jgi:hypothetical protein